MEKLKKIVFVVGMTLMVIFFGGFRVAVNQMTNPQIESIIYPLFVSQTSQISFEEFLPIIQTMSDYFAISLFINIILGTVYIFLKKRDKSFALQFITIVLIFLVTLLGSNLVAYPIAFFFFLLGILMIYEKKNKDITEENLNESEC